MTFKIYNCDFGIKINGQTYEFEHVVSVTIEDPERNRLTRGANASNTMGLAYRDGLREAKRWTIPILGMSAELKEVLDLAFESQTRADVYCIDRTDGSKKSASDCLVSNRPQQLAIDDSAESLEVSLEFETFKSIENHKS